MPEPYKRSRTLRRLNIKVSGKTVIHYRERKPGKAKCGSCGSILKGMVRGRPSKVQKTPKTRKVPERPYSGKLCTKCMRSLFVGKARLQ